MSIYAVQHSLQGFSGLPEDRYVNTFHVQEFGDPLFIDLTAVADAIEVFYRPLAGQGIANYMSNAADNVGRTIKIYDLSDAKPRTPVFERTSTAKPWTESAVAPLPAEVALCLSYQGDQESGVPQSRRRGRIYLGPLQSNALAVSTTLPARPLSTFINIVVGACQILLDDLAAANCAWVVYSPTNDPTELGVAGSATIITNVWVDNAFDTQRRRGEQATDRTSLVLT